MHWVEITRGWMEYYKDSDNKLVGMIYYNIDRQTWIAAIGFGASRKAKAFGRFQKDAQQWVEEQAAKRMEQAKEQSCTR